MYNTFILNYEPQMSDPSPIRLIEFVRSNFYTYQYMTPFFSVIIVKSTATLEQMIKSYNPFLSPNNFLLTQVAPSMVNGLLPTNYWQWINAEAPPPLISSS
ncbi:MAG: hypothetical protein JWM94_621 [Sphingomonas bacterium]|nr:hypothetical protein [Sphingomonas bacterium]